MVMIVVSPYPVRYGYAQTAESPASALNTTEDGDAQKKAEEESKQPPLGIDFRWKDGIQLKAYYKDSITVKVGGRLQLDAGGINVNHTVHSAYTALQGSNVILRSADFFVLATFYEMVAAKVEYEFANQGKVGIYPKFNDLWIASRKEIPVLGYIAIGNMKEPFSLETLTSTPNITFMERALPTLAFSPGYNWGFTFNNTAFDERVTWAAGVFYNTGNLNQVYSGGDLQDQFSTANGYSLSARVTGLPWYEEAGKRLLHLGVSYNFRERNKDKDGAEEKFSARPESYLTDTKFVNARVAADRTHVINGELAWVWGPFSLQAEYFHSFTNAERNPDFWGCYVYGSFFVTGEHRAYETAKGVFTAIVPRQQFNPLKGGWGAWELVVRYSYVDLKSDGMNGGKEGDVTVGLNWYLHPNVQIIFNYIRANATNSAVEHGVADIFGGRFQIAF